MILFGMVIAIVAIFVSVALVSNANFDSSNVVFSLLALLLGVTLILSDINTERVVETEFVGTQSYIGDLKLPEGVHAEMYITTTTPDNKLALYGRSVDTTYKVVLDVD